MQVELEYFNALVSMAAYVLENTDGKMGAQCPSSLYSRRRIPCYGPWHATPFI